MDRTEGPNWLSNPQMLFERGTPKVYRASVHKKAEMPIGGIGIGSIMLHTSGKLRWWRIFGNIASAPALPDTFFAIRTQVGQSVVNRILQTEKYGEFEPVSDIEFIGEFPVARLHYEDDELPIQINLSAFSPFVPLSARISATPCIIFRFHLHNPSAKEHVHVSLLGSLQNAVGYDGRSYVDGVHFQGYGGNINEFLQSDGLTVILMQKAKSAHEQTGGGPNPYNGTMCIATDGRATSLNWQSHDEIYERFIHDGELDINPATSLSEDGSTWNGALARTLDLLPLGDANVTFYLCWHFPNRLSEPRRGRFRIGHKYSVWFSNARKVCEFVHKNLESISTNVLSFHNALYGGTLPRWLLELIGGQLAVLVSPTAVWAENGDFGLWEGVSGGEHGSDPSVGCCGINCMHVLNYEMALAMLFPELERIIRRLEVDYHRRDDGSFTDKMYAGFPPYRPGNDNIDNTTCFPLKVCRDYLWTGERVYLELMWPRVKSAVQWLIGRDLDGDGIPDMRREPGSTNTFHTTYDEWTMYGTSSFIGSYWLATLLACERMATLMGDDKLAQDYRKLFERARESFENKLWNGEYYNFFHDTEYDYERLRDYFRCCISDQVVGQWWAHILGLGYILSYERIRKALLTVMRYNWFEDYEYESGVFGPKLSIYTYPYGERRTYQGLEKPGEALSHGEFPYEGRICYRTWTGAEMETSAHMIWEGMFEEALKVARSVYDRYDGVRANPWNHIECGSFYSRGLSCWSILHAASGFYCDVADGLFRFAPKLLSPEGHFQCWFGCGTGWGTFSQSRDERERVSKLSVNYGIISLRRLELTIPGPSVKEVSASIDCQVIECSSDLKNGYVTIDFAGPVEIRAGQSLIVRCA